MLILLILIPGPSLKIDLFPVTCMKLNLNTLAVGFYFFLQNLSEQATKNS